MFFLPGTGEGPNTKDEAYNKYVYACQPPAGFDVFVNSYEKPIGRVIVGSYGLMKKDTYEIAKLLVERWSLGAQDIHLVGHSYGGLETLACIDNICEIANKRGISAHSIIKNINVFMVSPPFKMIASYGLAGVSSALICASGYIRTSTESSLPGHDMAGTIKWLFEKHNISHKNFNRIGVLYDEKDNVIDYRDPRMISVAKKINNIIPCIRCDNDHRCPPSSAVFLKRIYDGHVWQREGTQLGHGGVVKKVDQGDRLAPVAGKLIKKSPPLARARDRISLMRSKYVQKVLKHIAFLIGCSDGLLEGNKAFYVNAEQTKKIEKFLRNHDIKDGVKIEYKRFFFNRLKVDIGVLRDSVANSFSADRYANVTAKRQLRKYFSDLGDGVDKEPLRIKSKNYAQIAKLYNPDKEIGLAGGVHHVYTTQHEARRRIVARAHDSVPSWRTRGI